MSSAADKAGAAGAARSARGGAGTRALAARVRTSKHLSRTLKRYWLTVLPHLQPVDQARLDAILRGESPATEPPPATGAAASAEPAAGT